MSVACSHDNNSLDERGSDARYVCVSQYIYFCAAFIRSFWPLLSLPPDARFVAVHARLCCVGLGSETMQVYCKLLGPNYSEIGNPKAHAAMSSVYASPFKVTHLMCSSRVFVKMSPCLRPGCMRKPAVNYLFLDGRCTSRRHLLCRRKALMK